LKNAESNDGIVSIGGQVSAMDWATLGEMRKEQDAEKSATEH
jgi:hypothetical protein